LNIVTGRSGVVRALLAKRFIRTHACFVALTAVACSTTLTNQEPAAAPPWKRTCLVLSVGGPAGLAHLGVITAVQQAGIQIDCIAGNSMGALIGAMYATAPSADTTSRYQEFIKTYADQTAGEKKGAGALGFLAGAALVVLSGGSALPVLGFGALTGIAGGSSVDDMDVGRTRDVLDALWNSANIETLPVPFAAWHVVASESGIRVVASRSGNLATAVSSSIANPLIFPGLDVRTTHVVDPGVDRVAAVPVDDACRLFPDARLIASNVTGRPTAFTSNMNCPLVEIVVPAETTPKSALQGNGPEFFEALRIGYEAAIAALQTTGKL